MTKPDFRILLIACSTLAVRFAQSMVTQSLSYDCRYHVLLNQSADHNATSGEVLYPSDDGKTFAQLKEEEVVELLCRENRCPEWIDISVEAVSDTFTLMRLYCCGRFTADLSKLYYANSGQGPFGVKSPNLPMGWTKGMQFTLKRV
jgi:hypothetical protein